MAKFDEFLKWVAIQPAVVGKRDSYAHVLGRTTADLLEWHVTKNLLKHFSIWLVEEPWSPATESSPASYIMAGSAGQ